MWVTCLLRRHVLTAARGLPWEAGAFASLALRARGRRRAGAGRGIPASPVLLVDGSRRGTAVRTRRCPRTHVPDSPARSALWLPPPPRRRRARSRGDGRSRTSTASCICGSPAIAISASSQRDAHSRRCSANRPSNPSCCANRSRSSASALVGRALGNAVIGRDPVEHSVRGGAALLVVRRRHDRSRASPHAHPLGPVGLSLLACGSERRDQRPARVHACARGL